MHYVSRVHCWDTVHAAYVVDTSARNSRYLIFYNRNKKPCSSSIVELYKHLGIFKNTREVRESLAFGWCFSVPISLNNALGAFFIPLIIYMKKKRAESQDRRNFEGVHALFVINLHPCYTQSQSFSANQNHGNFLSTLLLIYLKSNSFLATNSMATDHFNF